MRFIDRIEEVGKLEALWTNRGPQLALLYGRRRVGKSYILAHIFLGKRGVRFVASQTTSKGILETFLDEARTQLGDPDLTLANYPTWRVALRYFAEAGTRAPLFLIFDEFGYLVAADPEVPSIIQSLWTTYAGRSRFRLVLCGSQVSLLARLEQSGRPLYGNIAYSKLIEPLGFRDAAAFAPRWSEREQLMLYGCLGGTGRYLDLVQESKSLERNLTELILEDGPLHNEGTLLLTMEEGIREYASYHATLVAIAGGATQWGEIVNRSGVSAGQLQKVLDTLESLLLVKHEIAYGDKRRGIWIISDNFLRFWYRFIAPTETRRHLLKPSVFWRQKIAPHLASYMGWRVFEDICRAWVTENAGSLPWATADEVGRWWQRDGQNEIDVVVRLADNSMLFGSCKWNIKPMPSSDLTDLQQKVAAAPNASWRNNAHYALFSASGFDGPLTARAQAEDVLLIDSKGLLAYPSDRSRTQALVQPTRRKRLTN